MDKKFYLDVPDNVFNFLKTLQKDNIYRYSPTPEGLTEAGKSIELGFSCYAMKIYYMTSNFDKLSSHSINSNQRQCIIELLMNYFKLHLHGFEKPKSLRILHEIFQEK